MLSKSHIKTLITNHIPYNTLIYNKKGDYYCNLLS